MSKYLYPAFLLSAAAMAGCLDDDVTREVTFEATRLSLPSGTASGTTELRLEFSAVEPLESGSFVLWGVDGQGQSTALSAVEEGETTILAQDLAMNLADIETLVISEEELEGVLPSSMEGPMLLRGAWPGPLHFGALRAPDSFIEATVSASIDGYDLMTVAEGLPALPDGYIYGVSLTLVEAETKHQGEEEHADPVPASAEEHDEAEENGNLRFLGFLNDDGHLMMTSDFMLARGADLVLTIESPLGHEMTSRIVVMQGAMIGPDAAAEEESSAGAGHEH